MLVQLSKEKLTTDTESQTGRLSFLMKQISVSQIDHIIEKNRLEKESMMERQQKMLESIRIKKEKEVQECNKYFKVKQNVDAEDSESSKPGDWKRLELLKPKKTVKIVIPEENDLETKDEEKPEMLISLGDIFGSSKQTESNCDNEVESNEDTETQESEIRIGSEDVIEEENNFLAEFRWSRKSMKNDTKNGKNSNNRQHARRA